MVNGRFSAVADFDGAASEGAASELAAFDPDLVIAGVADDSPPALDLVRRARPLTVRPVPVVLIRPHDPNGGRSAERSSRPLKAFERE